MSLLDTVIKGSGNPVVLNITGTFEDGSPISLLALDDIEVVFGDETYTRINNPTIVVVASASRLELNLQGTSETRGSHLGVKVFNSAHPRPLGYTVTNACLSNLSRLNVCG